MKSRENAHPDLQSQYESLLDQVWRSEAEWRLWDRVDAVVMMESLRAKRVGRTQEAFEAEIDSPDSSSENAA